MEHEGYSMDELEQIYIDIDSLWSQRIVHNPAEVLTDLSKSNVIFAAGGALVTKFGDEESEIWKNMVKVAGDDSKIEIAGVNFELDELSKMGSFYRYLKEQGYKFHCIDERLDGDEEHLEDEVHEKCGACAAVGQATGLKSVEDKLLGEIGQKAKQEIYKDMPNHESMVILVDLRGADVVLGELRSELKTAKALPFNASIPLDLIRQWRSIGDEGNQLLVSTLVKWNVMIARNIIGGDHNTLKGLADKAIIVVDKRGSVEDSIFSEAVENIKQVGHGKYLEI